VAFIFRSVLAVHFVDQGTQLRALGPAQAPAAEQVR
jgi:hypothetical protein